MPFIAPLCQHSACVESGYPWDSFIRKQGVTRQRGHRINLVAGGGDVRNIQILRRHPRSTYFTCRLTRPEHFDAAGALLLSF